MKTNYHDCIACKGKDTVRIDSEEPTSEGFKINIHRCSNCNNQMTGDKLWEMIESKIKQ